MTVSGLKRIAGVPGGISVPVLKMADRQLKTRLGREGDEIADSGVRLRAAGCGLRAAGCGLRAAGCGLRAAGCGLRAAG
ncbi:S-adenosyl-L-homocysteine hydrolase, partial [Streptomyces sp. NPDC087425]